MDDQTCLYIVGNRSREKNDVPYTETMHGLFQMKSNLDRPLIDMTEENVREIAEQLRTIISGIISC